MFHCVSPYPDIAMYDYTEAFFMFIYVVDIPAIRTSRTKSGTFYSTSSSFCLVC